MPPDLPQMKYRVWKERSLSWYRTHDVGLSALVVFVSSVLIVGSLYWYTSTPPAAFQSGQVIKIKKGTTLDEAARLLEERGVIRSAIAFQSVVMVVAGEGGVVFGDYFFSKPPSMLEVARRVTKGDYDLTPVKVTVPEGANAAETAQLMEQRFKDFKREEFVELAKSDEGYLFPDTYFFPPTATAREIYEAMRKNFDDHIEQVRPDIIKQGKTIDDIVIMASIIEKEGITPVSRRIISGILWKRLSIGMPLQVDAPFQYSYNKNSLKLTKADLRMDSPYNTYKYPGLPIGPIANPGMDSILAAIYPKESKYLFYLSDLSSRMHYSITYAEHYRKQRYYLP